MFVCTKEQKDGFGSQFQNIIAAIVYASLNNIEYVHRPLKIMDHNYDNDKDYIPALNKTMNIDKKFRRIDNVNINNSHKEKKFKKYFDRNFEKCLNSDALKELKKIYMDNKLEKNFFLPIDKFNISIHIRNLNKHDSKKCYASRFNRLGVKEQNQNAITLMLKLIKKYNDKDIMFHIFSQGFISEFDIFEEVNKQTKMNITLHLDKQVELTFHQMVLSDVLVITKSSISYTAALLTEGEVYYKPFWHSAGKKWIPY